MKMLHVKHTNKSLDNSLRSSSWPEYKTDIIGGDGHKANAERNVHGNTMGVDHHSVIFLKPKFWNNI